MRYAPSLLCKDLTKLKIVVMVKRSSLICLSVNYRPDSFYRMGQCLLRPPNVDITLRRRGRRQLQFLNIKLQFVDQTGGGGGLHPKMGKGCLNPPSLGFPQMRRFKFHSKCIMRFFFLIGGLVVSQKWLGQQIRPNLAVHERSFCA